MSSARDSGSPSELLASVSRTLATSRSWNTADGDRHTETEWFNVVTWGNLAEICKQYLTKGQQVYVLKEGKPFSIPVKTGIGNNSGIELVEGPLKEGDEVLVEGPRALATGRAAMGAAEMQSSARGVAVRVRKVLKGPAPH